MPNMRFFRYYQNSVHGFFRNFCMNLEFLGQKISKMGFYKYYQKSVHGAFLTFYKKLEQHKDLKLSQIIAFGIILF